MALTAGLVNLDVAVADRIVVSGFVFWRDGQLEVILAAGLPRVYEARPRKLLDIFDLAGAAARRLEMWRCRPSLSFLD